MTARQSKPARRARKPLAIECRPQYIGKGCWWYVDRGSVDLYIHGNGYVANKRIGAATLRKMTRVIRLVEAAK